MASAGIEDLRSMVQALEQINNEQQTQINTKAITVVVIRVTVICGSNKQNMAQALGPNEALGNCKATELKDCFGRVRVWFIWTFTFIGWSFIGTMLF